MQFWQSKNSVLKTETVNWAFVSVCYHLGMYEPVRFTPHLIHGFLTEYVTLCLFHTRMIPDLEESFGGNYNCICSG